MYSVPPSPQRFHHLIDLMTFPNHRHYSLINRIVKNLTVQVILDLIIIRSLALHRELIRLLVAVGGELN